MILPIKKYPDPVLRKKCQEVEVVSEDIKKLGWDMVETMTEKEGIGLAAPQVGESKRVIVVHPIQERSVEERTQKKPEVFINPKIIKKSKETEVMEEGCLSFPGFWLKIKRAKEVEIEALLVEAPPHLAPRSASPREVNEEGEKIRIQAKGLPARIFQHEIDHLDGILFIDRISFWQRFKIRNELKKFLKKF